MVQLLVSFFGNTKDSTINLPGREPEGEVSIYGFFSLREFKLEVEARLAGSLFVNTKSSTVDLPGREPEGEVSINGFPSFREIKLDAVVQLAGYIFVNTKSFYCLLTWQEIRRRSFHFWLHFL